MRWRGSGIRGQVTTGGPRCSLAGMTGRKVVASNRKARFNYEILDTFEAGMVLHGSEVKSLRAGQAQLKDSYADIRGGEVWLTNAHISPYQFAENGGHEPERPRKLLLHRREIERLFSRIREEGLTLVPIQIYFKEGKAKSSSVSARARRPTTSVSQSSSANKSARWNGPRAIEGSFCVRVHASEVSSRQWMCTTHALCGGDMVSTVGVDASEASRGRRSPR